MLYSDTDRIEWIALMVTEYGGDDLYDWLLRGIVKSIDRKGIDQAIDDYQTSHPISNVG